jgi:predicted alpha/beta-fold hydrolase
VSGREPDEIAWQIELDDGATTSAVFAPSSVAPARALYVCGHGSGGHMDDAAMRAATAELRRRGLDVVRFNFVYREQRLNRPDPMPRLQACCAAVAAHARAALQPRRMILGGRSMGGRAASMLWPMDTRATGCCCSRIRCIRPASPGSCVMRTSGGSACRCCASMARATISAGTT